ncbi:MAG: hypothetical protein OXU20_34485, partial [Myxococcales bacterium]|nr:hypothetical protein [Myxococcales bacterium]
MERLIASVLIAVLACPGAGCSLAAVTPPPRSHAVLVEEGPSVVESGPPAECTRHVWLPVGDMLLAGANGTLGWVAASEDASAAGIGLLGFAALALVSGIYGFAWTSECRELEP